MMCVCNAVHPEAANAVHPGELVIDGGTLQHILGTNAEQLLASVGSRCGSVVICRSSPAQKAAVVHMMAEHDMRLVRTHPLQDGDYQGGGGGANIYAVCVTQGYKLLKLAQYAALSSIAWARS